ncbi:MAG: hypothetical protein ACXWEY_04545 [Bacteroidia bacterium]
MIIKELEPGSTCFNMQKIIIVIFVLCTLNTFGQKTKAPYDKGEFRIKLGLPYFNHIYFQPRDENVINKFGFVGESIGFEYSYSNNRFVETNFSFVGANDSPLPIGLDREGEFKSQYSTYLSLTHNNIISRFTFGYGLNYAWNTYTEGYRNFAMEDSIPTYWNNKTNRTMGVTLNSYYRIGNSFNIGAIYRPNIIFFKSEKALNYEHLISIELLWRIRLNNK